MYNIGGNKLVRFVLIVCVLMQVVALTPHHHHTESELPCVNFFHAGHDLHADGGYDAACGGACACHHGGGCADGCGHDDAAPMGPCTVHNIVLVQHDRDDAGIEVAALELQDNCHCGLCRLTDESDAEYHATLLYNIGYRVRPHIGSPLLGYISTALSPRAPDFKA